MAFICANATQLPFSDSAFDAVRSERTLQHLTDPARAAREMARVTRPGGGLVLIDTDWSSLTIDGTGDPATEQLLTEFLTHQAAASPTAGKDLPIYAAQANLQVLRVFPTAFTTGDAALLRLIAFLDLAEDAALATGQLDAAGLDAWRNRLAAASDHGNLSWSLALTMVIAVR